mgnify:FL=1
MKSRFSRHFENFSQGLVEFTNNSYINDQIKYQSILKVKFMSLRNKIDEDYKQSIKNKDQQKIDTLRLIRSAIKDKDISSRTSENKEGINDSEILSLLLNLIKQRNDSIEQFQKAKRDDLIKNEKSEIEVIKDYLPQQKTQEETEKIINEIISSNNLESIKDMGKLMSIIKSDYAGEVDMGLVGKIAKSKLIN